MKDPWPEELERARILIGKYASQPGNRFGAFNLGELAIMANAANHLSHGWEHVSVSAPDRCPTWGEMCTVKDLFWKDDEMVVQFHPPKANYVNCHPYTLHLWRPTKHKNKLPFPPSILVGPR